MSGMSALGGKDNPRLPARGHPKRTTTGERGRRRKGKIVEPSRLTKIEVSINLGGGGAKSDKLTKGDSDSAMAALAVALMSLARATDTGRGRIDELLDIAQSEASAAPAIAH
jgi:hypothetical protein